MNDYERKVLRTKSPPPTRKRQGGAIAPRLVLLGGATVVMGIGLVVSANAPDFTPAKIQMVCGVLALGLSAVEVCQEGTGWFVERLMIVALAGVNEWRDPRAAIVLWVVETLFFLKDASPASAVWVLYAFVSIANHWILGV